MVRLLNALLPQYSAARLGGLLDSVVEFPENGIGRETFEGVLDAVAGWMEAQQQQRRALTPQHPQASGASHRRAALTRTPPVWPSLV
eukprot:1711390-Prymnesium_polylepis.1